MRRLMMWNLLTLDGCFEGPKPWGLDFHSTIWRAALSATPIAADLFDEARLALAPVILGRGTSRFGRGLDARRLKLLEARALSNGGVILRYEPNRGA